jgi:hypothetical protein
MNVVSIKMLTIIERYGKISHVGRQLFGEAGRLFNNNL